MAIRKACQSLKSHDLTNCILYTFCEPCPMCLGAIIWANIKEVYYACTKDDAAKIGFRDAEIYEFIKGHNNLIELKQIAAQECFQVMEKYQKENIEIY